jgi:hypothetical protein
VSPSISEAHHPNNVEATTLSGLMTLKRAYLPVASMASSICAATRFCAVLLVLATLGR